MGPLNRPSKAFTAFCTYATAPIGPWDRRGTWCQRCGASAGDSLMSGPHIVLIHRYFVPDTPPYAHILKQIADELAGAGYKVTVLTCQPSYSLGALRKAPAYEKLESGVEVRRWPVFNDRRSTFLKLVNLAMFCLRLVWAGRRLSPVHAVMSASTPPVAVAKVGAFLAWRFGARFIYHKQDIWPEVVMTAGDGRRRTLARLLRWLDARTDQKADRVVVLSEDMALTERRRGVTSDRIVAINNFDPWVMDEAFLAPEDPAEATGSTPLRVSFAGNLGRFQNLETVFAAVVELRDDDRIVFDFFGDGSLRAQLENKAKDLELRNVVFHGYCDPGAVAQFLKNQTDLGVVSLLPGVIETAYPSKTMSYLRHGCPVLALVESGSDLARVIEDAGAGVQASPADGRAVAETLRAIADDRSSLDGAGKRAALLYRAQFSPERQLGRWVELYDSLCRAPRFGSKTGRA